MATRKNPSIKEVPKSKDQILCKRQVICWIENHFKKIDYYIEN